MDRVARGPDKPEADKSAARAEADRALAHTVLARAEVDTTVPGHRDREVDTANIVSKAMIADQVGFPCSLPFLIVVSLSEDTTFNYILCVNKL